LELTSCSDFNKVARLKVLRGETIKIIEAVTDMQANADALRRDARRVAFVPTMGFLHEGHLSLIRIARDIADVTVVSIFVNPAQFGPGEDFETYPRDLQRDLDLCRRESVDIAFTPRQAELYPQGFQTTVRLEHLPQHLCGLSRPVFFTGVATVVTKLFNIVKPHLAVFGEKDYQQLQVIRRMVQDLNLDIEIVPGPTVRESDGLAMSSRNKYLTADQRPAALTLFQSLCRARERIAAGERQTAPIVKEARTIIEAHSENDIDYLVVCDPVSLETVDRIDGPVRMAIAVRVATTRLIDNMLLEPKDSSPAADRTPEKAAASRHTREGEKR
jgi:pantoate--beta-alanine ligase